MRPRPTARALLSLTAVLALAVAGTAIAHGGGDHSRHDDDPAGTIASFDADSHMLTIDLADAGSISGKVTRWTWIDCDDNNWGRHRGHRLFQGSDGGHDGDRHSHCSTADLTAGAVVDDAVLSLRDGGAFFWKVDLEDEKGGPDDS